jgi:hypothetical protein
LTISEEAPEDYLNTAVVKPWQDVGQQVELMALINAYHDTGYWHVGIWMD